MADSEQCLGGCSAWRINDQIMTYSVIQSFLPNSICYLNFLANNEGAYIHGGQILGAALHGRLMIRSCQGWGSFTNALSGNLKTLYKFKILPGMKGYTLT